MAKGRNVTQQIYTNKNTLKKIYETCSIKESKYVYDCCMGDGNWLEFEKEQFPETKIYGNDIDKKEVVKAIKRLKNVSEVKESDNTALKSKFRIKTLFKIDGQDNIELFHADSTKFNVWDHKEELFKNSDKFLEILDE